MDPPAHPFLLKIHKLDQRSSDFQQRLDDILHTPEYKRHVGGLKGGDLEWFVEYLDKVCRCVVRANSLSSRHYRSSTSLMIVSILFPGSVGMNSEGFAAIRRYSPDLSRSSVVLQTSRNTRLPPEVLAMCTRGPSVARRFASNA